MIYPLTIYETVNKTPQDATRRVAIWANAFALHKRMPTVYALKRSLVELASDKGRVIVGLSTTEQKCACGFRKATLPGSKVAVKV